MGHAVLTPERRAKIEEIRHAVAEMIAFRDRYVKESVFQPSEFWRFTNRYISYIRELSAEQLENIRCHIGMGFFLGNPWEKEFYAGFRSPTDRDAETQPWIVKYLKYTEGLPEKHLASEYETTDLVSRIGVRYRERLINSDVLKEQAAIANMYNLGLLDALDGEASVIEIGPGYGQLASQLSRGCGRRCRFVLIDYPETLFWSAVFITLHAESGEIYIWKPDDDIGREAAKPWKYFFVPNFALEGTRALGPFDLAINGNSFQEMAQEQIESYARFLAETTRGWLYSYNANRQFMNRQIEESVLSVLRDHFVGGPEDHALEAAGFDLCDPDTKRLFVGHSKIKERPQRAPKGRPLWIADKPFEF